jgi:8-oxo-dGTP diphosphatase
MSERHQLLAASFVFLERDGKVLFLRKLYGFVKGLFDIPAGHLEAGETFKQAACREALEEVGVTIDPNDLELIHAMEYPDHKYFYVFFRTKKWQGEPRNMEPEKHADLCWSIPSEQPDPVRHVVAAWKRAQEGERWSVWHNDPV